MEDAKDPQKDGNGIKEKLIWKNENETYLCLEVSEDDFDEEVYAEEDVDDE